MAKFSNKIKRRSGPAKELATPLYRQRIVQSKKLYSRKRTSWKQSNTDGLHL